MKRDFAVMRREFVEGVEIDGRVVILTLEEVAARHGYNASNLRKRAGKERWTAARSRFTAKVQQKREEARAVALGSKGAKLDAATVLIAERALELCRRELDRLAPKTGKGKTDHVALKRVLENTRLAQNAGRLALGKPLDPGDQGGAGQHHFDLSQLSDDQLRALADRLA